MISTIEELLNSYNPKTIVESKLALREIMQSIVLVALSRNGFFSKASFYGGTALRIFYDLNRFSEDLDFTLNYKDENFTLDPYINKIKEVALSYGFYLDVSSKVKQVMTPVKSAFAKINTFQAFITLKLNEDFLNLIHKDEVIKVKIEIDSNPALGFKTENKWIDIPEFANIAVLDLESLFAGKIHAILCRNYKNTVKGRDYYDFIFYARKKIKPNMLYLKNKLIESYKISNDDKFDLDVIKNMLIDRFNQVDFNQVKNDAMRFVLNKEDLTYYSKDLFIEMTNKL